MNNFLKDLATMSLMDKAIEKARGERESSAQRRKRAKLAGEKRSYKKYKKIYKTLRRPK